MMTPLLSRLLADSSGVIPWLLDLAAHWQWLYLFILVIGIGLTAYQNWRYLGLLVLVPIPWLTAYEGAPRTDNAQSVFSVATANVNVSNRSNGKLVEWIAKEQPDLLVLLEVSHDFANGLEKLDGYPRIALYPENSPFGIGIHSKYPLSDVVVKRTSNVITHIEAQLDWNGRSIRMVAFHPMPPLSPEFHTERNQTLETLTQRNDLPTIIAGDFNATPWSSAFSGLADQGFRRATELAPTWPTLANGIMGIPIDHVLISDHWGVVGNGRGEHVGSDHLPSVTHLGLHRSQ